MKNNLIECGLHFDCGNSSGVEHNLAKVGVADSSSVFRSRCKGGFSSFFVAAKPGYGDSP